MKAALLPISFIAIITFFAFTKPKKPIYDLKGMKKNLEFGYSYVPSGNTIVDGDTVSCQGFFMLKNEVSNFNYLEFLFDLKKNGKTDEYTAALPDTLAWRTELFLNEKYVDYYLRHPAYRNYPVVNISREQAENYCKWLTKVLQERTGNEKIVFRLPKRAEFLRAANGSSLNRTYSWNSPYLRNSKGQMQCNFLALDAGSISRDSITGKLIVVYNFDSIGNGEGSADITAPIRSYWPNEFGLYHLNGNVSEMVDEDQLAVGGDWNSPGYDVRNQSSKKFTEANPTVGFRPVMTFVETK